MLTVWWASSVIKESALPTCCPKIQASGLNLSLNIQLFRMLFFWATALLVHTTITVRLLINVHLQMFYSFPNLGILHVTKKNVSKVLEERMIEAFRMGYNCGIFIHPEIDTLQGEVRMPRELTGRRSVFMCAWNFPDRLCLYTRYPSIFLLAKSGWLFRHLLALPTFIPASPQRKWWHAMGCITIGLYFSSQKCKWPF